MPSLDTIRTVTIRGQTDGVDQTRAALDRLTASINAANQNLAQTKTIANDNREGWSITGEGAASAANHLRQAAEAAYAFSPAFRGVVNEMAMPALKLAGVALEGVAEGIVTAVNVAGTGVIRLGTAIETSVPAFALLGGSVRAAGVAMEAFSPTLGGAATTILARLLPALSLLGKGLLIYDAIKLVTEAWRLGNEKLAEYVALSEKAAASGVSTDFYQRIAKAAEDAKTPVAALTEAFKQLTAAAAPTLGGSTAQNRLTELVKAGNFGGNSAVGDLKGANSNEERLRALADLYDKALEKGQRLAALDIVKAFGGDQLAANLAKDSGYLDKMLESADEIASKELVKASDIQNAVELQNRLDAAEKILSQRWHPIQDLLTSLGIKMRETWVSIVESIAKAVDTVFKLIDPILSAIRPVLDLIQKAGQLIGKAAPYLALAPGGLGLPAAAGAASIGVLSTPSSGVDQATAQREALMADARRRLAEGLNRLNDNSKPPPVAQQASAYDRAVESVNKYIEVTKAATATVGLSNGAQEKAKVVAQLTAAAMKDGTPITAALREEMAKLGDKAGAAAEALEKAKVASDIKFDRAAAFLTPQDLQIAQQLKGLYGNDIPAALASSYAAEIRFNNALRELSSLGQEVNRGFLVEFGQNLRNGENFWQAFEHAGLSALGKIADKLASMAADQLWSSAFGGSSGGGLGGGIGSLFGLGGGAGTGSVASWSSGLGAGTGGLSFPMFASGTNSAPGGPAMVNEDGGEILDLPSGTRVIPHDVSMAMAAQGGLGGGGGQTISVTYAPNIDARGADAAALARLVTVIAQDKKNFERNVQVIVARTRANTPGF
ncbi:hypothetical protein IVA94_14885 [Bradyrhizobium sp. 156]|uniref:hypothetical protein n=1 Tax=Bradyrhizobium sp. 156 TaxID=2782630 RepID=UPI001FFA3389|nr:hypothetical protein [Bradyrhizobium sp. 156]MCK1322154.1 hypothetical protein [Bradyrhizobium sp. 156]